MKEHIIQLRIKSEMNLDTLVKNFPPTILVKNTEAEPNQKGHHQLDMVYVKNVIKVADSI